MQFVNLVTVVDIPEATNILLVFHGYRPATLLVINQELSLHLTRLFSDCHEVGFRQRCNVEKKKVNIIIYNTTFFQPDQVDELASSPTGMGKLLGYIASSDEMGIQSKYKIEYRVNGYQLYAQVCRYLDDDRRDKAEEHLVNYQKIGSQLGLDITLYCGERKSPQGRPYNDQIFTLTKRFCVDRHQLANRLDANFPQTASYLRIENRQEWLSKYRQYRRLWLAISRFNPEVAIPNLEMSLYQGWELRLKTLEEAKQQQTQ